MNKKLALFTLFDSTKADYYALRLIEKGWKIVATKETHKILKQKNIPCVSINDFVGIKYDLSFPPTLHPKIEAALTDHSYKKQIDMVFNIPYPIDNGFDVGGHTLIALAVKGDKLPIMSYGDLEEYITAKDDDLKALKVKYHKVALLRINKFYQSILRKKNDDIINLIAIKGEELIYGENPYQEPAALYYLLENGNNNFKRISGDCPCYTNIADIDNLYNTIYLMSNAFKLNLGAVPFITIAGKHGNPCGISFDWELPEKSIDKALWGSPKSIWGGEVVTNYSINDKLAELLIGSSKREVELGNRKWMFDVIAVPEMEEGAINKLSKRKRAKLIINKGLFKPENMKRRHNSIKTVDGGLLIQPYQNYILDISELRWSQSFDYKEMINNYIIAWAAAYTSFHGGNEIALARENALISVAGGPSTVEAAKIAVWRAKENNHNVKGSIFVADAFFPFSDAPKTLIDSGCISGLVPGGGMRQGEIEKYFNNKDCCVGFIPEKYRGFCRH